MVDERSHRRLAAILAADVVGYSRLMQQDEAGTLAVLKSRRSDILRPAVSTHRGRIVKFMGDGVLVEFASAVDAVECAVQLQQAMHAANANLPDDRRIVLRIGINVGDVIVEGSDIYGDGVNIAARLEGAAEPGSICTSEVVFKHVRGRVSVDFEDLGEQSLKNIAEPIRVYRVAGVAQSRGYSTSGTKPESQKPSIAVLPFDNMSGDPQQQYFSDGITEDIITELSRFQSLFVIARNSSFQYRGKTTDVRRIARELNVQYVVEGSIRRGGQLLRITAQLIEAATGNHLWAERYDRLCEEVFAVQDEVVQCVVVKLEGRLAATVAEHARRKLTPDLAAYDYVLQARAHLGTYDVGAAEPLLLHAIKLDPGYAQAYAWLAHTCMTKFFFDTRPETLDQAEQYGRRAIALNDNDGHCHAALANVLVFKRQFEQAGSHLNRAIVLNRNDVYIFSAWCHWLTRTGRHDEALRSLEEVRLRDPFPADYILETQEIAQLQAGCYEDAIETIREMPALHPWNCACLAGCYAQLGKPDEAARYASETLRMMPDFKIHRELLQEPFKNPDDTARYVELLRKAGLPE
jgi:adenylate cyclase